jgi:hypothetical protein
MHWPLGPRGVLNVDDATSLPSLRDRALIDGSIMSCLRTRSSGNVSTAGCSLGSTPTRPCYGLAA